MVGYGGGTTSAVQIAQLSEAGWGMMIGPTTPKTDALRYAADNGAFPCWTRGEPWKEGMFLRMLDRIGTFGRRPDFGVCPDIVAGGAASLDFSMAWVDRLPKGYPWYLAVQDGMTGGDVLPVLPRFAGIFVGGTTDWKMASCPAWALLARQRGKKLHVGRVDTVTRAFTVAKVFGADSFDGNNWNRIWSKHQENGRRVYRGGGRGALRGIRDTAKPMDVVNDQQRALDLWGLHRADPS